MSIHTLISSSDNHLLLKFLRVPASPRLRVSPNDKSSPEHDMIQQRLKLCSLILFVVNLHIFPSWLCSLPCQGGLRGV